MFFGLLRKRNNNRAIVDRQYAALTAAARVPALYEDLAVPDTVMGRLEMLSIVMILFFRRTARSPVSGQELAQEIIDAFFTDIDHSIRELGVGDQGVPKRMKKIAGMFYGRVESYGKALDAGDEAALAEALARNIYPETESSPDMRALARYMITTEAALAAVPADEIASGALARPAPAGGV